MWYAMVSLCDPSEGLWHFIENGCIAGQLCKGNKFSLVRLVSNRVSVNMLDKFSPKKHFPDVPLFSENLSKILVKLPGTFSGSFGK